MTVCIAALFRFNYSTDPAAPDWGTAVLTASDRMITAGDVEYEPFQIKMGQITPYVAVLIAGDYTVHSHAIKTIHDRVKGSTSYTPFNIATMYGSAIQEIQKKMAEDSILAPLGLNTDSFLAQQKEMSDQFIANITMQLQDFRGPEVEAIIAGLENNFAHIYTVDQTGSVRSYDDVGFAAIGIGAWHARSTLMQARYVNTWNMAPTLAVTYAAKKSAEIAPGIGSETDIRLIGRHGIVPVWPNVEERLKEIYEDVRMQTGAIAQQAVKALQDALNSKEPEKEAIGTGEQLISSGNSEAPGHSASEGTHNAAKEK